MDIAALSIGMNQAVLSQNVSLAVTKLAMDHAQQNATQMIETLQPPHPTSGHLIDLKG